jgi:putative phosphoribosyl transferase
VDDIICLATPKLFRAVGQWYRDFRQISDAEVQYLLADSPAPVREASAVTN